MYSRVLRDGYKRNPANIPTKLINYTQSKAVGYHQDLPTPLSSRYPTIHIAKQSLKVKTTAINSCSIALNVPVSRGDHNSDSRHETTYQCGHVFCSPSSSTGWWRSSGDCTLSTLTRIEGRPCRARVGVARRSQGRGRR